MEQTNINADDTLFSITETYPETIPVFTSNGFPQMGDPGKRKSMGEKITLKTAVTLKQQNLETFIKLLRDTIQEKRNGVDSTLDVNEEFTDENALNVMGLLPCPVRIPLLEQFGNFAKEYSEMYGSRIRYELKAASMGLDWVEENIKGKTDASQLPDLFVSAGFDMFFDEKMIGRFKKNGDFSDAVTVAGFNPLFKDLSLKDPRKHYSIISVVPAVFLINMDELGDRRVPESWADILSPEFEKRVSLPVGDFDLFNGILLNIHKKFGDDGVRKLGRSLLESLHPSQMVKSEKRKTNRPIVTIMPYFFTKMVKEGSSMKAVWPSDGAIISPIFLLSKREKIQELQPVIDFFASKKVGEILAHQGLFPSTHPEVDNGIPGGHRFMWLGWDYIYANDIAALIRHCDGLFTNSMEGEKK